MNTTPYNLSTTAELDRMHIMVLGLRGFPGIEGGVETHSEQLYTRIAESTDYDVEIITRSAFWPAEEGYEPPANLRFQRLWSPKITGAEALIHSLLGTIYAILKRPDVLHIHAVGPALFTPLARLFGIKVVFTHHGPDYEREKWGGFARIVLRMGEAMGAGFANTRIVISEVIRNIVQSKHNKASELVFNGVEKPAQVSDHSILESLGLAPHKYALLVSRVVPEKRQLDLIEAFQRAKLPGWKLAIVGDTKGDSAYAKQVRQVGEEHQAVVLADFQSGEALAALYQNAGLFVLPSTHEGLPIALLEALSYGLPVVASDIPANLAVGLGPEHYFRVGDIDHLAQRLRTWAAQPYCAQNRADTSAWTCEKYNWEKIAAQTVAIYEDVASA